MTHYSRHQLWLLLLLVAAAGAGLAVDHWRRARPDVGERVERLDRVEPAAAPAPREARRGARERREHAAHEHALHGHDHGTTDRELADAGIAPGHASLWPNTKPEDV